LIRNPRNPVNSRMLSNPGYEITTSKERAEDIFIIFTSEEKG